MEIAVHAMGTEVDRVDPTKARIVLVEGTDRVLPPYVPSLSASAQAQLEEMGVGVRTHCLVTEIDDRGVSLSSRERIEARTVLWAAGVQASPVGEMVGEIDRVGRVLVEDDLSVPGHPEVLVAGDLAAVDDVPGVAPAAMQMGRHVGRLIGTGKRGPLPLSGQGIVGDDWRGSGCRRHQGRAFRRVPGLFHVADNPHLLSDRLPQPLLCSRRMGLALPDIPEWSEDHYWTAQGLTNQARWPGGGRVGASADSAGPPLSPPGERTSMRDSHVRLIVDDG